MADQISNSVSVQLDQKLQKLDYLSLRSSNGLIFKVPHQLRRINEKAYEPQIISIGPYHRDKQHLKAMEIHKLHYLKTLLQRQNENVGRYVDAMRAMEDKARKCYEQTVNAVTPETFIEMMILDGCFIVELIGRSMVKELRKGNDELFTVNSVRVNITHDLLLLENQLPFFVLLKLFAMSYKNVISNHQSQDSYFIPMALGFFAPMVPGPGIQYKYGSVQDIRHLLDLVHKSWRPSPQGMERYREQQKRGENLIIEIIRSASELREAGVKFEKITLDSKFKRGDSLFDIRFEIGLMMFPTFSIYDDAKRFFRNLEQFMIGHRPTYGTDYVLFMDSLINSGKDEGDSLFDIRFENGRMMIPALSVYDYTERFFRNLMVYEQFMIDRPTYVTDYVLFMDSLINSGKDVEILCRCGIIKNWLGDDEVVATMFNRLRDLIFSSDDNFYYAKAFYDINRHCKKRCNIWKAKLRHNYFNTPWAMISFFAAFALLLLTLAQTIYSILSYFK